MSSTTPLFGPGGDSTKIRNGFNHFSDVFSQFSKHITPAFNHERPERSVQMRLYTLQKGQFLLIFVMFFCLFFIALLMGLAGPRIITQHVEHATKMVSYKNKTTKIPQGPFIFSTPMLTPYRQQLWIDAQLVTKTEKDQESFTKKCDVFLTIEGVTEKTSSGRVHGTMVGGGEHKRSRMITCNERTCDPFTVAHLGVLTHPRYLVNITFVGLEIVDKHFDIEDIIFTVSTYNPQFTHVEVWFRFFFVLATCGTGFAFLFSLRNFSLVDWSIEQKWVAILLPALLGFDNPLFSWTILSNSLFPAALDAVLQSTFLFSLLLFWLCIFHGLRQTNRGLYTFYLPKFLLVGTMWFSAVTMAILEETNELRDPSFSYQINTAHYKNFQLYFISMLAVYVVYLLFLCLRAFGELRAMNFLDSRLKFHAASMLVVAILTLSIVTSRYGSGILEDNFVAKVYTSYDSGGQFLALYTVINCYVYILAYVYSPTTAQTRESHLMRDNPTFSMVNESDDESEAMLLPQDDGNDVSDGGGKLRGLALGDDDDSD